MVTNYTPDKCRYTIGKLVKSVWLISENAIKDIRIDNGEAWVNSISETPIRIDCTSVGLQEEESLDERYRFVHTLTFSVNGYANGDDFQGKYYAIVKDNNGTYWLVNPLFPCKVTYVYTLSNDENHTDFTLSTASNHPVLRLNGMVDARAYECKEYFIDGISELWLNEKRYSVHDGKDVKYTNDGFKVIDYNKNSATFTETFDGTNTSHSISFDVLFSSYKSSWHYNLLEFIDECIKNNNLYSAIIKTRNGKYAMCGFSYGLQPSFNITADDTTQEINKIQISLQDVHTVGDPIDFYNSVDYTHLTAKTWVYTDEYDGYICVGDGLAKYLLQKEVDALGNDTCNYKALTGYENNFPELNIVGTFDDVVTYPRNECRLGPCRLSTSLPLTLTFNAIESQTYTLKSGSYWNIESSVDYITVNPSSGNPNTTYTIEVHNSRKPTNNDFTSSLTVNYCNTSSTFSVEVIEYDGCFPQGASYEVPANEQTITIPIQCCIQEVKERTGIGIISTVYSNYISVYIPKNDTGNYRTGILLATLCDGSATNITIVQTNIFEKWVDDHSVCIGNSKYMVQYKYTGTTEGHEDTRTDETRTVLIEEGSQDCRETYRWVKTDTTYCVNNSPVGPSTSGDYLTFIAEENCAFKLRGNSVYYSTNSGTSWTVLPSDTYSQYVPAGSSIMWKAMLTPAQNKGIGTFDSVGRFRAEGNPMSLLFGDNFDGQTNLTGYNDAFYGLFSGCSNVTNAEYLYLPATTLSRYCYAHMFDECTSLTTAPTLPATTMTYYCYSFMFDGCTSLTTAPTLPATTMAEGCYYDMFCGSSIRVVPNNYLPATTLAKNCYNNMFGGTKLVTIPNLPATTLVNSCYSYMFSGCENLTSIPSGLLPATAMTYDCYSGMFKDCKSLTTVPSDLLPATNLYQYCYSEMFSGCVSLTVAPDLPATTSPSGYNQYNLMFKNCVNLHYIKALLSVYPTGGRGTNNWAFSLPNTGTFVKSSSATWGTGISGIPEGWTIENA